MSINQKRQIHSSGKAYGQMSGGAGAQLDPLQVLEALSEDMPLQMAAEILTRMLRERIHRHVLSPSFFSILSSCFVMCYISQRK